MARITAIECLTFEYGSHVIRDEEGHAHPGPERRGVQTLTRVRTDVGVDGHCIGGSDATAAIARRLLVGLDPFDRELIHQRLRRSARIEWAALGGRMVGVLDQALWDVSGRITNLPVHKLLGASRDRVPAYASTMCGDDRGLGEPADYATFARACVKQGYRAFKLHTWMPPFGPDLRRDIAACQAVRDAVGPDVHLMLDPFHDYTREDSLLLGRALEELGFHWLEEPMDEHSISSYAWLCRQLDLPICGPESIGGGAATRAEWIVHGAADILRTGLEHGGITSIIKTAHLCEAFGVRLELHGGGAGTLQALGAMAVPGEYYERGLLHPELDYDAERPWLRTPADAIDADGCVRIPTGPGLGEDIDWDYVREHVIDDWH
jgi:L-alanine-DL-glutamate epimerase-like enolase superfamily enzyme